MRRTTMTLTSALMLSACFGAPQVELADDPAPATITASVAPANDPVTTGGQGNDAAGGQTDGEGAGGEGADGTDPADPADDPRAEDPSIDADDEEDPADDQEDEDSDEEADEPGEGPGDDPADDPAAKPTAAEAARFLMQASFGPDTRAVAEVQDRGYAEWLARQAALPPRSMTERLMLIPNRSRQRSHDVFWEFAVEGDDQLRQRVAFALSQIVVVSTMEEQFIPHPATFTAYADILQREAFGNYEDLIREVAMSPAMGLYLSHLGNEAAVPERGNAADENFARELLQLFTIGLDELTPKGEPTGRPAYTNADVAGLAKAFTGLSWADTTWQWPRIDEGNETKPMVGFPEYHDQTDKTFLGATVPGGLSPEASVQAALDHVLAHPNVGPFVGRQLIVRLITSNPSPDYVGRVAAAYEAGRHEADGVRFGTGRRGDMAAVVAAIYLDEEARSAEAASEPGFGRVRSPVLRFAHFARTFRDGRGVQPIPESSGRLRFSDMPRVLGQRAWAPPSVFGYSRPGYVAPGTWSERSGLAAPGLTHATGVEMIGYIRHMKEFATFEKSELVPFFRPGYDRLLPLADDPEALVAEIALLLTADAMLPDTRARIAEALTHVDLTAGPTRTGLSPEHCRVALAVLMATTAPTYSVQR